MISRLIRIFVRSAATSLATSAAVTAFSKRDTGHYASGLNATSHILWGDEAMEHDEADLRHTLVGALLNAGAMVSWSVVGELLPRPRGWLGAARNGALISGLAYFTDFYVVPRRLTPGFEARISKKSLLSTYGVLAASYALASHAGRPTLPR